MFAGVQGRGAQDAWYMTAVDMETAFVVHNHSLTGGAADIHKCFDQIMRPVVHKVAEAAGIGTTDGVGEKPTEEIFEAHFCATTPSPQLP